MVLLRSKKIFDDFSWSVAATTKPVSVPKRACNRLDVHFVMSCFEANLFSIWNFFRSDSLIKSELIVSNDLYILFVPNLSIGINNEHRLKLIVTYKICVYKRENLFNSKRKKKLIKLIKWHRPQIFRFVFFNCAKCLQFQSASTNVFEWAFWEKRKRENTNRLNCWFATKKKNWWLWEIETINLHEHNWAKKKHERNNNLRTEKV